MYKAVFQNSKVALIFAGLTILSAVSIVGTPEDGGVVGQVTGLVEARSAAGGDGSGAQGGSEPASGEGGEPSVFGDYAPAAETAAAAPSAGLAQAGNPMTAELSATAVIDRSGPSQPLADPFSAEGEPVAEQP